MPPECSFLLPKDVVIRARVVRVLPSPISLVIHVSKANTPVKADGIGESDPHIRKEATKAKPWCSSNETLSHRVIKPMESKKRNHSVSFGLLPSV